MCLTRISFEEHDSFDYTPSKEEWEEHCKGLQELKEKEKEYDELPWWKKIFKKQK